MKYKAGVDWGSTSFRAYRYDTGGKLLDCVSSSAGIKSLQSDEYENTLFDLIGHWLIPGDSVLLTGMITSANGWHETPYLKCPVSLSKLADHVVSVTLKDSITALFFPGVCTDQPVADVMRGEELQLYGALDQSAKNSEQIVVLPGTHSKWARLCCGELITFSTIITGELFDLLFNHSLVGALAEGQEWFADSFRQGVQEGYENSNLVSRLFAARSSVLLKSIAPKSVHSYLSGLLIGNEIRESALQFECSNQTVTVIGSELLTKRYLTAFKYLDIPAIAHPNNASATGFARLLLQGAS